MRETNRKLPLYSVAMCKEYETQHEEENVNAITWIWQHLNNTDLSDCGLPIERQVIYIFIYLYIYIFVYIYIIISFPFILHGLQCQWKHFAVILQMASHKQVYSIKLRFFLFLKKKSSVLSNINSLNFQSIVGWVS